MKEQVKKMLAELSIDDIHEITNELNNLCTMLSKSPDTLFLRYIAFRDYHSKSDFRIKNKIRHDTTLDRVIRGEGDSIEAFLKLKKILNIDDTLMYRYMKSIIDNLESQV